MNCIELARGKSPLTRTRTKSESVPIVFNPLCDLLFIGDPCVAAVDLAPDPTVAIAAKALPEAPVVPCWVPTNQPEDLGLLVSEGALRGLPDEIRNGTGLVKHDQDASTLVMQTRKGLDPVLRPRHGVDPPGLGVGRIARRQGRRRQGEELGQQRAEPKPFGEFSPGLGAQLAFGVGRHYPAGVFGFLGMPPTASPYSARVGAEQSEGFLCARTESPKSGAENFTPLGKGVVG
jgi:hypothetical protein